MRVGLCTLFLVLLISCTTALTQAWANDEALFRQQVGPIFERHCLSCHNGTDSKGDLSLATAAAMRVGGESGQVKNPG